MHFTAHIAIPSDIQPDEPLHAAVDAALAPFSDFTSDHGQWDWWVIGGRWGGYWVLKPAGEIGYQTEPSTFGQRKQPADGRLRADAARIVDIEPESLHPPNSYIDSQGQWQTIDPFVWDAATETGEIIKTPDDEWDKQYLRWIQSLNPNSWLVNVDCHN